MSNWRLAAVLILAVVLLGVLAITARAQGAWVHGIVQDKAYQPVNGGDIWLERQWRMDDWLIAPCCESHPMQGHAFGWTVSQPGRYRLRWEKRGYAVVWTQDGEFTVPGAPVGDIVVNVRRIPVATATPIVPTNTPRATPTGFPVPTTLYPPTVETTATATATPTAAPCLEFQQFTWAERRSVIATAAMHIGRPLEDKLDWDHDLTLLHGLRDMMLGAPLTRRFEVTISGVTLTARGFCQAIIVMRPVEREECLGYGVVGYDGTQNWMAK